MNYSQGFWDRIANYYAKKAVPNEVVYQKKLALTRSILKPNMKVLEFGCGTGSTAVIQAKNVAEYTAIDISPKMINIANQKKSTSQLNNLNFQVCAFEEVHAANRCYDAIMAMSILHLMNNRTKVLDKVYHLLKPGGYFISNTACIKDRLPWFRYIAPIGRFLGIMPRVEVFSYQDLEESINGAGFDIQHSWIPGGDSDALFLIAQKPAE